MTQLQLEFQGRLTKFPISSTWQQMKQQILKLHPELKQFQKWFIKYQDQDHEYIHVDNEDDYSIFLTSKNTDGLFEGLIEIEDKTLSELERQIQQPKQTALSGVNPDIRQEQRQLKDQDQDRTKNSEQRIQLKPALCNVQTQTESGLSEKTRTSHLQRSQSPPQIPAPNTQPTQNTQTHPQPTNQQKVSTSTIKGKQLQLTDVVGREVKPTAVEQGYVFEQQCQKFQPNPLKNLQNQVNSDQQNYEMQDKESRSGSNSGQFEEQAAEMRADQKLFEKQDGPFSNIQSNRRQSSAINYRQSVNIQLDQLQQMLQRNEQNQEEQAPLIVQASLANSQIQKPSQYREPHSREISTRHKTISEQEYNHFLSLNEQINQLRAELQRITTENAQRRHNRQQKHCGFCGQTSRLKRTYYAHNQLYLCGRCDRNYEVILRRRPFQEEAQ